MNDRTVSKRQERNVDVAVIGVGTAGQSAAREVAKVTDRFVVIDDKMRGTTCAFAGCMPSKVLIQVADDYHRRHVLKRQGIKGAEKLEVEENGAKVMAYVRKLRDGFVAGDRKGMKRLGKHLIAGTACFLEPQLLEVDGQHIRAKKVVVATGSSPVVPGPWKEFSPYLLTTESLFEMKALPRRLAVIGLGPVGLELGQALARLGVEVFGFEMGKTVGGASDPVVSDAMCEQLRKEMELHLNTPAKLLNHKDGVAVEANGEKTSVDAVLVTVGRRHNLDNLGLNPIGVEIDEQGRPEIDPATCRIPGHPIYVAGDATGRRAILHEASDEGRIAGYNAVRQEDHSFVRRTPLNVVFCSPNIVAVGERYDSLDPSLSVIGEMDFSRQSRAKIMEANFGVCRIYATKKEGRLLGAEMAVTDGEHLGHLLAWSIYQQMTVYDLLQNVHYHPTLEEGLRRAIRDAAKKTELERPSQELALCDSCACV